MRCKTYYKHRYRRRGLFSVLSRNTGTHTQTHWQPAADSLTHPLTHSLAHTCPHSSSFKQAWPVLFTDFSLNASISTSTSEKLWSAERSMPYFSHTTPSWRHLTRCKARKYHLTFSSPHPSQMGFSTRLAKKERSEETKKWPHNAHSGCQWLHWNAYLLSFYYYITKTLQYLRNAALWLGYCHSGSTKFIGIF